MKGNVRTGDRTLNLRKILRWRCPECRELCSARGATIPVFAGRCGGFLPGAAHNRELHIMPACCRPALSETWYGRTRALLAAQDPDLGIDCYGSLASQGLKAVTPAAIKSLGSRVATARPWWAAVAAMRTSGWLKVCPDFRPVSMHETDGIAAGCLVMVSLAVAPRGHMVSSSRAIHSVTARIGPLTFGCSRMTSASGESAMRCTRARPVGCPRRRT